MYMGTPRADWHAHMCAGVESGYLPFILAFNFNLILLYCSVCASICVVHKYFIVILIIFIHSTTCQPTPVTTPYLHIQSVLYSHSLMNVAVQSLTRLNCCKTWANAYQRIMTVSPSHSGLYNHVHF